VAEVPGKPRFLKKLTGGLVTVFALKDKREVFRDKPMSDSQIFKAAVKLRPQERAVYLENACGANDGLRQEVESLLAAHDRSIGFLKELPTRETAATIDMPLPEPPGTQIGPYKLREKIGEGGFGVVYVAQQSKPVRRNVALKIIKAGMDTKDVIARFEAERQALALMDHPNIAKVLDAGATQTGRPYFVMELVRGVPITEFCDERKTSTRERLLLFVDICRAIQHAHQKGIIHRDLKPSNIMVTLDDNRPIPKVIDFGISKALSQQLTENSFYTAYGQMIGTPLYMAPEQAQLTMRDVDTRSDVYSLGVLLYELLTGTTPFDKDTLQKSGFDEMRRIIREVDPPRPSARVSTLNAEMLSTIAARHHIDPRKLSGSLRGELDWIVMKALEKDRNRRYETASAFAADVARYLNDEPVQACPPSAWYRFAKYARRKKTVLTISSVVVLASLLAVGSVGYTVRDRSAREQERERERSRRAAIVGEKVDGTLKQSHDRYRDDKLAEALTLVEQAAALLAGETENAELSKRVLRWRDDLRMADRLEQIRIEQSSIPAGKDIMQLRSSTAAYRKAFQEYGLDVGSLKPPEAAAKIRQSAIKDSLVAALANWRGWQSSVESSPSTEQIENIIRLADDDPWRRRIRAAAQADDAEQQLAKLARDKQVLAQSPLTLSVLVSALSRPMLKDVRIEVLRHAQRRSPNDFWTSFVLANHLRLSGDPSQRREVLTYFHIADAIRPGNFFVRQELALELAFSGRYREAEEWMRDAVRLRPGSARARLNLGWILSRQNKRAEAIAEYREAIRLDPNYVTAHRNLGNVLEKQGNLAQAEAEFRAAVRCTRLKSGKYDNKAINALVAFLLRRRKFDEAEAIRRKTVLDRPRDAEAHWTLGVTLRELGKFGEALAALRKARRLGFKDTRWSLRRMESLLADSERLAALESRLPALLNGEDRPKDLTEHVRFASLCFRTRKPLAAARLYREILIAHPGLNGLFDSAAYAAAMAGCGRGREAAGLDETERARWRQQALSWIRAALEMRRRNFKVHPAKTRRAVLVAIGLWKTQPALSGLRDAPKLAKLPARERVAWRRFWSDVDALLLQTRGPPMQRIPDPSDL
jgi:eukaryotic-like serine/threonine-protein kinase